MDLKKYYFFKQSTISQTYSDLKQIRDNQVHFIWKRTFHH